MESLFFWLKDDLRSRLDVAKFFEPQVERLVKLAKASFPEASPLLLASIEETTLRLLADEENYISMMENVFQVGIRLDSLPKDLLPYALQQRLYCEIGLDALGIHDQERQSLKASDFAEDRKRISIFFRQLGLRAQDQPRIEQDAILIPSYIYILPRPDWMMLVFKEINLIHHEEPDLSIVFDALPESQPDLTEVIFAPHVLAYLNEKLGFLKVKLWESALSALSAEDVSASVFEDVEEVTAWIKTIGNQVISSRQQPPSPERKGSQASQASAGPDTAPPEERPAEGVTQERISRVLGKILTDISRRPGGPLAIGFALVVARERQATELGVFVLVDEDNGWPRPVVPEEYNYQALNFKINKKIRILGPKNSFPDRGIYLVPKLFTKRVDITSHGNEEFFADILQQRIEEDLS